MPRYRAGYTGSTSSASTGAISESAVVYRSAGGHSHDGLNSSLIDMNKYTVWDFDISTIYTNNSRYNTQLNNIDRFKNFITNHVANDVLGPAGITLGENIINANNIIAGSITTDLLATNAITSRNYSYTSGNFTDSGSFLNLADGSIRTDSFYLDGAGNMYIAGDVIIGATAASDIESGSASGATSLQPGEAASDVNSNTTTISGGKIRTGEIESTGFSWNGSSTYSTTGTRIDLDDGQIIGEEFRIDSSGNASFAGAITGGTITIGSSNTVFKVNSSGDMWLGNATQSSAPFQVTKAGALTASSATVTGTVNATAGYIGNSSYGFNITNVTGAVNYSRIISNDNTGSGSSRGKVDIRSYGDILLYSTPTSGNHANQSWNTQIVGEYIVIEKTSATAGQRIRLGNTTGNGGTSIEMDYDNNNRVYITCENLNYGYIRLRNSGNTDKITLSGENGDATFARYLNVGSDSSVLGRAYFKYVNDVSTSGVSGSVIIGGDGSGAHIAIDNNEIMAKSSPTAATTLYLNNDGGTVHTGGDIDSDGQYYGPYDNGAAGIRHRNSGFITFDVNGGRLIVRDNNNTIVANVSASKTFVISHPSKPKKFLVHAVAEGPTSDVFYRGESKLKNGECVIVLPDYFEDLTELEGRTVTLTPIYNGTKTGVLSSSKVIDGRFTVYSTDQIEDGQEFYWRVDAIRKNTAFDVEPDVGSKKLMGDGPYTYLV